MHKFFALVWLITMPTFATSVIPSYENVTTNPRYSNFGHSILDFPRTQRECAPVFNSAAITPEIRNELMDVLRTMEGTYGDTISEQDDAKKILEDLMSAFNRKKDTPIFIDPKTGKVILAGELSSKDKDGKPKIGDRPDALKGCVSRSTCTGTGKDRECTVWEVCISSD